MSSTVTVPKLQTSDYEINTLQNNIINALQPLGLKISQNTSAIASNPVQGGQFIKGSLSTSPLKINQTLGKVPSGWIITDIDATAEIHRTAWDVNSITLVATGNCNVSILVF